MNALKGFCSSVKQNQDEREQSEQQSEGTGGFLSSLGDKLNAAAGGGRESEKNEDYLDKGNQMHGQQLEPLGR